LRALPADVVDVFGYAMYLAQTGKREAKKQGLLSDYKVWNNVTTDGPDDWDVAVATVYPNFAAIDQIDAKAATISTKHYGSREAMIEAAKKRNEIREVVASKLAREVMPK